MPTITPSQLLLSHREYEYLREAINDSITDDPRFVHLSPVQKPKRQVIREPQYIKAFRAATRVYLATNYGLQGVQALLNELTSRRSSGNGKPRKPLVASPRKLAISLASLLFFHRWLYAVLSGVRRDMLRDIVRTRFGARRPWAYAVLSSRLMPAAGASLSGLALGICPKDMLRVTVAIYALVRAGELLYQGAEAQGWLRSKPKWVGSWIIAALSQGQLLHSFVFDPDCFPAVYGDFILNNSPEYVRGRPAELSNLVKWPTRRQQADALADMARLKWPTYLSPILRPKDDNTLPRGIDPIISPITSRAHPALQHLSCALLHPTETSCFTPFLRQVLLSFSSVGKLLTMYYGALSLLRINRFIKQPISSITRLCTQILRSTAAIVAAISGAWGSICFTNNYLPRSLVPKSRFFLAGTVAGSAAIMDSTATGHGNNMYVLRNSIYSLWKVGVKRRWWSGVKAGDVYVFVIALAAMNMLYDSQKEKWQSDRGMLPVRVLRGDIEIGLKNKDAQAI